MRMKFSQKRYFSAASSASLGPSAPFFSSAGVIFTIHFIVCAVEWDTRAAGHDHVSQTEFTVGAVLKVRPDMTASKALAQVDRVRRS